MQRLLLHVKPPFSGCQNRQHSPRPTPGCQAAPAAGPPPHTGSGPLSGATQWPAARRAARRPARSAGPPAEGVITCGGCMVS